MLDVRIDGATIVDGTGSARRQGTIAISQGRIVAVGAADSIDESAATAVDGTGLIACPGFIDPHTHYDAQLFWDPQASPSDVHGVTTVIGGNCSFGLAPMLPAHADYNRRLLAKVEGMPLEALEQGVPWGWSDFGGYLRALDGKLGMNAGFLLGHSALRRHVLGAEANSRESTEAEVIELRNELGRSLDAGALGFSTDVSDLHSDGNGDRVPARGSSVAEILELCEVTGQHPGTTLAGIFRGGSDGFDEHEINLLADMSVRANRILNWNVLVVDAQDPDRIQRQMAASVQARQRGGRVVALTMPSIVPMNMSFGTYCALNLLPGWGPVLNAPVEERIRMLRDPHTRRTMEAGANSDEVGMFRRLTNFAEYVIGNTYSAVNAPLEGRMVSDIAAERGTEPFDALVDIVIADELRTVLWPSPPDDDDVHWALRADLWKNPDVLLGGSDAGAHLDRMCGSSYPTLFLSDTLRGRQLVTLEEAIHMLSGAPAQLFGLAGRGNLVAGAQADIVLFDPQTVGAAPATLVHDLPGGAPRLTAASTGVHRVFVNGVTTVIDGASVGALPGTALRSGRDTTTVTCQ